VDGALTGSSISEQGCAGLDRLQEAEYARLQGLNAAYPEKFHFPFIVCVRRHTRESIPRQFDCRTRPGRARNSGRRICRIAALRLHDLVEAADTLPVAGRLSPHVLDTHGGRPADGIALALCKLGDDGSRRLIVRT
jgi:2-oxo-4-hydroxy-4-carboxy-5-ureidoimidazoline decarboxylase